MIKIKEIESYKDYGRVLSVSNGVIEAYVTLDIGPRVIFFGFAGSQNIMNSNRLDFATQTDKAYTDFYGEGKYFENFGGHRIWTSPESFPETYYPDCNKVEYKVTENGAVFLPNPETENSIAKKLEIAMDPDDSNMKVTMTVTNIGDKPLTYSVWGLSVCEKDGTLIIPMNSNDTGLLPNRIISVWPYTDMSDSRIYWGKKYVTVHQDRKAESPIKLGFDLNRGTVYYVLGKDIFCKAYEQSHPTGVYPDGGCSFETYTNDSFIEVETLSELKEIKPFESNVLCERWSLCKKPCNVDFKNDASIDEMLEKL